MAYMHVKKVTVSHRSWKEVLWVSFFGIISAGLTFPVPLWAVILGWGTWLCILDTDIMLICSQGRTEFDLWFSVKLLITMSSVLAKPCCCSGTVQTLLMCMLSVWSVCSREVWGSGQHAGQVHMVGCNIWVCLGCYGQGFKRSPAVTSASVFLLPIPPSPFFVLLPSVQRSTVQVQQYCTWLISNPAGWETGCRFHLSFSDEQSR